MSIFYTLCFSTPSDDDFIEKIKDPSPDLDKAFEKDSMTLSQAVLTLRGYAPGRWLDDPDNSSALISKLSEEYLFYHKALEAIRGRQLSATDAVCSINGKSITVYYIYLPQLAYWAHKKGIWMHRRIDEFVNKKYGTKNRGRPQDCPEIVDKIALRIQILGDSGPITGAYLQKSDDPEISNAITMYLEKVLTLWGGKPKQNLIKRRLKTLSGKVRKLLVTSHKKHLSY